MFYRFIREHSCLQRVWWWFYNKIMPKPISDMFLIIAGPFLWVHCGYSNLPMESLKGIWLSILLLIQFSFISSSIFLRRLVMAP